MSSLPEDSSATDATVSDEVTSTVQGWSAAPADRVTSLDQLLSNPAAAVRWSSRFARSRWQHLATIEPAAIDAAVAKCQANLTTYDGQAPDGEGLFTAEFHESFKSRLDDCGLRSILRVRTDSSLPNRLEMRSESKQKSLARWVVSPLDFSLRLWGGKIPVGDIQYFYYRDLCNQCGIHYGTTTAGQFYELGLILNQLLDKAFQDSATPLLHWETNIVVALAQYHQGAALSAFLECCLVSQYFEIGTTNQGLMVRPRGRVDAEYLLSHVFSMPTASDGLNQLFGGSGPLLTTVEDPSSPDKMPGRVCLITGRFGTGKTALALLLASEAARKGGIVWYFSTEQSIEEVLYSLKTITFGSQRGVKILTSVGEADEFIGGARQPDQGVLVILSYRETDHQTLWRLLEQHSLYGAAMPPYIPLRLAVVDSLNAVTYHMPDSDSYNLRKEVASGLEQCTSHGMNVLLLEENSDHAPQSDYRFIQNIADTVIELSVESPDSASAHGYARRYIQILKSRYQRDQRGRHGFSIRPPHGLIVTPSTPAARARVESRSRETRRLPGKFGMLAVDNILHNEDFRCGELTVIQGDPGTFKSLLSTAFLNAARPEPLVTRRESLRPIGLLLTMRSSITQVRDHLKAVTSEAHWSKFSEDNWIRVCRMPSGFVTPGEVLQNLRSEIEWAIANDRQITRVVLDDIGEWPNYSPYIQDEQSFAPALFDFLSRYPFLVMATLSEFGSRTHNSIQQFVVEHSDRLIQLERFEHAGRQRALLRVITSPLMSHERDAFELGIDEHGMLQIDNRASLFEVVDGQKHSAAGVQLYLQSESLQQRQYNLRVRDQLRAMLSPDVVVENPDLLNGVANISGFSLSAITKLQIMQVDGFRLHRATPDPRLPKLHEIKLTAEFQGNCLTVAPENWCERLRGRVCERNQDSKLVAVPYYDNLSFLVSRHESELNQDWPSIAAKCAEDALYFDFPQATDENYNSLFLEIFLWCVSQKQTPPSQFELPEFRDLLNGAIGTYAIQLFSRIAGPAYRKQQSRQLNQTRTTSDWMQEMSQPDELKYYVDPSAKVWRHWFTTFRQMQDFPMSVSEGSIEQSQSLGNDLFVSALPGGMTSGGEWYLCIPTHSAIPSAGSSIVELLTTLVAERERFDLGIGLPVRSESYDGVQNSPLPTAPLHVSELTLDFFKSLQQGHVIRRDMIEGYAILAPFLANWLRRLLTDTNASNLSEDSGRFRALRERLSWGFRRTISLVEKQRAGKL